MKLNEAIILTESFKDLKTILKNDLNGEDFSSTNAKISHLTSLGARVPHQRVDNINQFVDVLKWGIQHPGFSRHRVTYDGDYGDVSTWIRMVRSGRFRSFPELDSEVAFIVLNRVIDNEQEIADRRQVKDSSFGDGNFVVTKLDTFEKARTYCNMHALTWCIGASPDLHDDYGDRKFRETYAVMLPNKTHLAIHSGPHSWLITDHSNTSEVSSDGSSRNPMGVMQQISRSGIGASGMMRIIKQTIHPMMQRNAMMELI